MMMMMMTMIIILSPVACHHILPLHGLKETARLSHFRLYAAFWHDLHGGINVFGRRGDIRAATAADDHECRTDCVTRHTHTHTH